MHLKIQFFKQSNELFLCFVLKSYLIDYITWISLCTGSDINILRKSHNFSLINNKLNTVSYGNSYVITFSNKNKYGKKLLNHPTCQETSSFSVLAKGPLLLFTQTGYNNARIFWSELSYSTHGSFSYALFLYYQKQTSLWTKTEYVRAGCFFPM